HLKPPEGVEDAEGLRPLDDPQIWAKRLADTGEDTMLVGHLPHLSKLASLLLSGDEDRKVVNFVMSGITCLERDESGSWSVRWMLIPETI
ncbi:MAG: phosphohistidine phosphatase SixA, partial [Candidatus Geothermarchaeales archaeon]